MDSGRRWWCAETLGARRAMNDGPCNLAAGMVRFEGRERSAASGLVKLRETLDASGDWWLHANHWHASPARRGLVGSEPASRRPLGSREKASWPADQQTSRPAEPAAPADGGSREGEGWEKDVVYARKAAQRSASRSCAGPYSVLPEPIVPRARLPVRLQGSLPILVKIASHPNPNPASASPIPPCLCSPGLTPRCFVNPRSTPSRTAAAPLQSSPPAVGLRRPPP